MTVRYRHTTAPARPYVARAGVPVAGAIPARGQSADASAGSAFPRYRYPGAPGPAGPGFPKDGDASPCVARHHSGTLGKTANCQVEVSAHLVNERASRAADWRLFCPQSWDDIALDDPVAGIPAQVRHREKWRLALDMIEEMTGPGGWGVLEEILA